jgi:RNA polymerase sigma-70 factor (ECF subfamily)
MIEKTAALSTSEIESFLDRARRGDAEAFTRLVHLHQARVRTYLDRFLSNKDRDIVDDLAQQTFLDAFRSLSSHTGETAFDHWLLRIAKNRALTYLRDQQRRRAREEASVELALAGWLADRMQSGPGDPTRHEQRLSALQACLNGLPETSRQLVANYYFHGQQGVDIARGLGKKQSWVWVTLLRIRQALRQCIELRLKAGEVSP